MKWNLKPWQIGLICAAGVVVIGGVGTGIWYGVTHADSTAEEDTIPSVVESVQDAEPALDDPTVAADETEIETESLNEPETVTVYVTTNETAKQNIEVFTGKNETPDYIVTVPFPDLF